MNHKDKNIVRILYNQILDNQAKRIYPIFDPDAHTREEYLIEKNRIETNLKEKSTFWKWMDRIFN